MSSSAYTGTQLLTFNLDVYLVSYSDMNSWRNQGSHTLVLGKSFCKFSLIFKLYSFFYRWWYKGSLLGRFMAGRLATLHSNSYPSHNCKSKRLFHFIHSRSSFSLNWNFSFIETSITQKLNNLNFSCYLLSSWIYYLPSRIREFSHWIPQTYFFVKVFVFSSFQTLDFFLVNFIWNSKAAFKVKALALLEANKKV